jgi:hypothetical protein
MLHLIVFFILFLIVLRYLIVFFVLFLIVLRYVLN